MRCSDNHFPDLILSVWKHHLSAAEINSVQEYSSVCIHSGGGGNVGKNATELEAPSPLKWLLEYKKGTTHTHTHTHRGGSLLYFQTAPSMSKLKSINHVGMADSTYTNHNASQYLPIRVNCLHPWMSSKAFSGDSALGVSVRCCSRLLKAAINVICSEMINRVMCVSAWADSQICQTLQWLLNM